MTDHAKCHAVAPDFGAHPVDSSSRPARVEGLPPQLTPSREWAAKYPEPRNRHERRAWMVHFRTEVERLTRVDARRKKRAAETITVGA